MKSIRTIQTDPNFYTPRRLLMIAEAKAAGPEVAREMDALLKNPEITLDEWGQPIKPVALNNPKES